MSGSGERLGYKPSDELLTARLLSAHLRFQPIRLHSEGLVYSHVWYGDSDERINPLFKLEQYCDITTIIIDDIQELRNGDKVFNREQWYVYQGEDELEFGLSHVAKPVTYLDLTLAGELTLAQPPRLILPYKGFKSWKSFYGRNPSNFPKVRLRDIDLEQACAMGGFDSVEQGLSVMAKLQNGIVARKYNVDRSKNLPLLAFLDDPKYQRFPLTKQLSLV